MSLTFQQLRQLILPHQWDVTQWQADPYPHRAANHAFLHCVKDLGRVAEALDGWDEGKNCLTEAQLGNMLAGVVITADRMAEECGISLEAAVLRRLRRLRLKAWQRGNL